MACVNISGRLYPLETVFNVTESDDSSEFVQMFAGPFVDGNVNFSSSMIPRPSSKELPGIFCMRNPEQMLEQWEIKQNLAMLISYSVIFVIGVVGNITAMLV